MMLRAFGLFVLVFAVLSLVVHLNDMGKLFGTGAFYLFDIELAITHFAKRWPSSDPDARAASALGRNALYSEHSMD
jgi:hypothetical protein